MVVARRFKKSCIALGAVLAVAVLVFIFWLRDRYVVPILTYHNVSDHLGEFSLNNVTPQSFAWQMNFLKKYNYHVISFDDYVQAHAKGLAFARNTVVIHFDDGYDDNYTNAYPILKRHRFPAMVFLVSGSVGKPGFLNWNQIKEMEAGRFMAGSHTHHHVHLPDVPYSVAKDEILTSKAIIEARLGHPILYFVYPSGGFTEEIKGLVEDAGYKAAGTTNRGRDRLNRDLFELNRIRIKNSETHLTFWAKLTGYYNLFRRSRYSNAYTDNQGKD